MTDQNGQKGYALLISLILIFVVTCALLIGFRSSWTAIHVAGQDSRKTKLEYAEEGAFQRAVLRIKARMHDTTWNTDLEPGVDENDLVTHPYNGESLLTISSSTTPAFQYEERSSPTEAFDVRYHIATGPSWNCDNDSSVCDRVYSIRVSALGTNQTKSAAQQDFVVRRENLFKYGIFYDDNLELTQWGDSIFQGPIHTNKNLYIENDQKGSGFPANSTMQIWGPVTAAGHIYRGHLNALQPTAPVGAKIQIFTDLTDTWVPRDPTKNAYLISSGPTATQAVDAITPLAGFQPSDLNDPSKEGVSWKVDDNWTKPNETKTKFNDQVKDVSLGAKKIDAPDATEIAGKIKQGAHLIIETTQPDADTIEVVVKNQSGVVLVDKTFLKSDIGDARYFPGVVGILEPPGAVNVKIGTTTISTKRGRGPNVGSVGTPCANAFYQERVWSAHEDMFVYNTVINVPALQNYCLASNADDTNIIYATRTRDAVTLPTGDAIADGTIDKASFNYAMDEDRQPYGYTLSNCPRTSPTDPTCISGTVPGSATFPETAPSSGILSETPIPISDTTLTKPFIFATDNPVTIRGDFNRHTNSSGKSADAKMPNGVDPNPNYDPQIDPTSSSYDRAADLWQPAAIVADRITTNTKTYDVTQNNLFRRSEGRMAEFDVKLDQKKCQNDSAGDSRQFFCYVQPASPDGLEDNAIFIAGQTPTRKDYTAWLNANPQGMDGPFQNTGPVSLQMKDGEPKQSGGFPYFLRLEENFRPIPLLNNPEIVDRYWGSFLNLFTPKFATHYQTMCQAGYKTILGPGYKADTAGNYCGAWKKGGTGGGWKEDRHGVVHSLRYDPNLARGVLPKIFKRMLPSGPAVSRKPYEMMNYQVLEPDPLR